MNSYITLQGLVPEQGRIKSTNTGNVLIYKGRPLECWTNAVQEAVAPQPLDLSDYAGKFVEVRGQLHGSLWSASFVGEVEEAELEGYTDLKGVAGSGNKLETTKGRTISCFRHRRVEAVFLPLNLGEFEGRTVSVYGYLTGNELYDANITEVGPPIVEIPEGKEATSLADLLVIRQDNRALIERVNGNLGTAVGVKWTNGKPTNNPCVIVFVPQKISTDLLDDEQRIPAIMRSDNGLWCFTDVVTGGKATPDEIENPPPLNEENIRITEELRSGRVGLVGGIQLAAFEGGSLDSGYVGTAGIPVRQDNRVGFLTNQHVGDSNGRRIYHPRHFQIEIGHTKRVIEYVEDQNWYKGLIDETDSYVRCDCAYIEIDANLERFMHPWLHGIGKYGPILNINMDDVSIIGQKVIAVGRTRGVQRGTIVAFSYEWNDDRFSLYTDFLIIGEDGKAFSDKGDSGKVIITDDAEHRPLALLWGGWQEKLREGRQQEKWTYAIDLVKVLERLNLDLL